MTVFDFTIREKHQTLNRLLEGESIFIHINTSFPDIIVPAYLLTQPSVTLQVSRRFRGKLELLEAQLLTDLLFGDDYFSCAVPLVSVWGATDATGKNFIWHDSMPESIKEELERVRAGGAVAKVSESNVSASKEEPPPASTPAPAATPPKKGPQLRRVK